MDAGSILLLLFVIVVGIGFGILQLQSGDEKAQHPVTTSTLRDQSNLMGEGRWLVTITRRSGYVHDEWETYGTAKNAIDSAVAKLHQARIYEVAIRVNKPNKLDVAAFYESTGRRRTGKYIGGFVIQAL